MAIAKKKSPEAKSAENAKSAKSAKKAAKAAAPPKFKLRKLGAKEAATVSPYLTIRGARAAVELYKKALGAKVRMLMEAEDKKRLMHATLLINGGEVLLSDAFDEFGDGAVKAPSDAKLTTVTIHLQVDDADKWWDRAVAAGFEATMPMQDQFWGDRYGRLRDPFGHAWSIGAEIKKKKKAR